MLSTLKHFVSFNVDCMYISSRIYLNDIKKGLKEINARYLGVYILVSSVIIFFSLNAV